MTRAFHLTGAPFEGLNVVDIEEFGDISFRSNTGDFAVRSLAFFVHEGGNPPLPLSPLFVPARPKRRVGPFRTSLSKAVAAFPRRNEKKDDLRGFIRQHFDEELDAG